MKSSVEQRMSLGQPYERPYRLAPQRAPDAPSALQREMYTVAEVAEMLGRSRSFIDDLINEGHLPARRFPGRRTRFVFRSDLDALVNGMEEV